MILPHVINLPFKAEREYLQGGDIFNALVSLACPSPPISLRLHQIMRELIEVRRWTMGDRPEGLFVFRDFAGEQQTLSLRSTARKDPARRFPFDEQAVTSGYQINAKRIEMVHRDDVTFIERCIALNKLLHNHVFPRVAGRWIVVRIDLNEIPDSISQVSLAFRSNAGSRLTCVELEADARAIGDMYFSLVSS